MSAEPAFLTPSDTPDLDVLIQKVRELIDAGVPPPVWRGRLDEIDAMLTMRVNHEIFTGYPIKGG